MKQSLHKLLIVAASILLMVFSITFAAANIKPPSISDTIGKEHPSRLNYEKYLERYDDHNEIHILVESEQRSFVNDDRLFAIDSFMVHALQKTAGISAIRSLTTTEFLKPQKGIIGLASFFDSQGKLKPHARNLLLEDQFWKNKFLSKNGHAFIVTFKVNRNVEGNERRKVVENIFQISDLVEKKFPGTATHVMGTEVIKFHFLKEMQSALILLPLCILGMSALVIFFLFRSWRSILMLAYLLSVVFFLLIFVIVWRESGISPFASFALFLSTIITTTPLVHFMSKLRDTDLTKISEARQKIFKPCLFTTITTSIGFACLLVNDMASVRSIGLYCVIGTVIGFVVVLYLFPYVLKSFQIDLKISHSPISVDWQKFGERIFKFRVGIVILVAVFAFWGLIKIPEIKVDDDILNKLSKDHELSVATDKYQEYFSFVGSVQFLVTTEPSYYRTEKGEKELLKFQSYLKSLDGVASVSSIVSFQSYLRKATRQSEGGFDDDPFLSASIDKIRSMGMLDGMVERNETEYLFSVFVDSIGTRDLFPIIQKVNQQKEMGHFKNLQIEPAGIISVRTELLNSVIRNFSSSFTTEMLALFIVISFILKSLGWGVISLIPNLLPLIAIGAVMSVFSIPLSNDMIVVACAVVGVSIDDTVHFLYSLRKNYLSNPGLFQSLMKAYADTSDGLMATTSIFICSMPCFFVTDLAMFYPVAICLALGFGIALLTNLIVLPGILSFFTKKH